MFATAGRAHAHSTPSRSGPADARSTPPPNLDLYFKTFPLELPPDRPDHPNASGGGGGDDDDDGGNSMTHMTDTGRMLEIAISTSRSRSRGGRSPPVLLK